MQDLHECRSVQIEDKKHHHDVQSELQELWANGLLISTGTRRQGMFMGK